MRIKPVRNSNGEIIDQYIYIYDQDDNGNKNFSLYMETKDFIETVHIIDKGLHRDIYKTESVDMAMRSGRTR